MRRTLLVLVVVLGACSGGAVESVTTTTTVDESTTTTEATTSTADQFTADKALIVAHWRALSDAYSGSPEAGLQFTVDSQYPGTGYTVEQCVQAVYNGKIPAGLKDESIVDQATIQLDPGWKVPGGPLDGQVPVGRTYIMTVKTTTTADGYEPDVYESEVHVTILDGRAYMFSDCD